MQSRRILVVEDFEGFRRFVRSLLLAAEIRVELASDGFEGVQKAEEIQPDLILLDIGLPNLNGMEVARRVRKLVPAAKIVFLSAESDADLVSEALSLSEGYIHKQRAQSDLLPALEAVFGGGRFVSPNLGPSARTDTPAATTFPCCSDDWLHQKSLRAESEASQRQEPKLR